MPKKVWDEERLKPIMLELRKRGKSYREIAKEIGCSTFTVSKILSPFENPNSRLKQAAELAEKVERASRNLEEIEKRLEKLKAEDLVERLSKIEKSVKEMKESLRSVSEKVMWIEMSAERRVRDDSIGCIWLSKEGYCTKWYWHKRQEGWEMKADKIKGKTVWRLKVKNYPLICTSCPSYEPRRLTYA
jgi:ParB-like chromosome segregation protein Spo0J